MSPKKGENGQVMTTEKNNSLTFNQG